MSRPPEPQPGASDAALQVLRKPTFYARTVKPFLDRFGAAFLLVVLSPLVVAVAVLVWATLGRPLLYRQTRVGHGGEPFEMLKFRTMHPDRRRYWEPRPEDVERRRHHKTRNDPRHTRSGRFLRRWSLDELPQLWNVLQGDLSLIGPRPELMQVVARYEPWQHGRHVVKPGLTGLWQVTERDEDGQMHRHVDTDLRYVKLLSPALDFWILLMTVPAVFGVRVRPRGPARRDRTARSRSLSKVYETAD